jgi:hypothetical protein
MRARVFGVESHGFQLNPTLREGEVGAFEELHHASIPEDFRQFVTAVGNGGAGPFYGVFPLGQMDDNFGRREWREGDGSVGVLSEPFPFETAWNDLSLRPADELAEHGEAEYERQMAEFEAVYWSSSLVNGAIPICHEGCAIRVWLVVTGTQAGRLWEDRRSEYGGLIPIRVSDGSQAAFSDWYSDWIESCLLSCTGKT